MAYILINLHRLILESDDYPERPIYLDHLNLSSTADKYCQINNIGCHFKSASDVDISLTKML
jgi:hypothetical protein